MKEQQLLMVTTLIMDFQGAKVVIQVKEMLSFSHTVLPHVLMTFCDIYRVSQEEWTKFLGVFLMLKYTDITQNTYIQS